MNALLKQNNVAEEMKARDQIAWVGIMNNLKSQAEETIFAELIFN